MQFKDYYKVLDVKRDASPADIKKAYRKQARKFHPDMNKAANATQSMAEVNEANDVLADPSRRAAYDTLGNEAPSRGGNPASQHEFHKPEAWGEYFHQSDVPDPAETAGMHSEFFDQLFGQFRRKAREQGSSSPLRGEDQHAEIELNLVDAYFGAEKNVVLQGAATHSEREGRPHLQVKIPKGVFEGQQIRLAGHGSLGSGGGVAGDLLLDVHFKRNEKWRTQGRDVYGHVLLAPWEAALGPWLKVSTPDGEAEVKIPEVWKAGRSLRLKGRGIPPSHAGKVAGDLYLELVIVLPAAQSKQEKEAYANMEKSFADFHPRAI